MRAILTYHSVDGSGSPISIDPVAFRRHIQWLAQNGPPVVSVGELIALPPREAALAITFDDAFVNFADAAWPVLSDHGLPVTLFVPTSYVGRSNEWSASDRFIPQLPLLDWDRLGRLAEAGVEIGSHTCSHRRLPRLAPDAVRAELERSADELARRLGTRPSGLAYPYGADSPASHRIATELYRYACTTELRVLADSEDAHRLPRLDAYYLRGEGMLQAWGTPRLRLYLRARAGARRWRDLMITAGHR